MTNSYATHIESTTVQWQCPHCRSPNSDDFVAQDSPTCQTCETVADWDDILSRQQLQELEAQPLEFINQPLQMERLRLAESHLRLARREGLLGIAQTKYGLLNLYYEASSRTYQLVQCGEQPKILAQGKKRIVKPVLAHAYIDDTQDS